MCINKVNKKILSLVLSSTIILAHCESTFAITKSEIVMQESIDQIQILKDYGVDTELVKKLLEIAPYITFDEGSNHLKIEITDAELIDIYHYTEKNIIDLHSILNGTYQSPEPIRPIRKTRATRCYISNADLTCGAFAALAVAAEAGPAALMATWTSMSTALGGVIGTGASLVVGALGYSFFVDLAFKITKAIATRKGIAIYLDMAFPPMSVAVE